MKTIILATAALALAACQPQTRQDLAFAGAMAAETGAQLQCAQGPLNATAMALLVQGRAVFDAFVAPGLTQAQRDQLAEQRAISNVRCGSLLPDPDHP